MTNYARAFYYLNRLNRRAYWTPTELEEYQTEQLKRVITYAYNHVPFYKRMLRQSGITPEEIKSRRDLNRLPVIRKTDIKQNLKEIISDEYDPSKLRMVSTSGSTGEPLFLYLSSREIEFRKAKHLRANTSLGQKAQDRWVTLVGPQHFSKTTKFQRLVGWYVPTTLSVFNPVPTQISMLEKLMPNVLDGYSSSLLILAKEVEKLGISTIKPRFIVGGAELIDVNSRSYIENVFEVPFYDQYSSVEFERMAWQCPERKGYHIDADALILQFVDKNGEEVTPGESGEIICTSLFNYAMPFIRYAIGDVGIPSDEICPCGRTLGLMQMIEGRKDSLLPLPNGQMLTPRALTYAVHLFKFYDQIAKFRVIQKRLDLFEVIVKPTDKTVQEDLLRKELVTHLLSTLPLEGVDFQIEFVDDIPLDKNGKLRIVVSQVTPKR